MDSGAAGSAVAGAAAAGASVAAAGASVVAVGASSAGGLEQATNSRLKISIMLIPNSILRIGFDLNFIFPSP
jgi:hypothetical protein